MRQLESVWEPESVAAKTADLVDGRGRKDTASPKRLAAIMFTDMIAYSALAQRSESLALEILMECREILRTIFPAYSGREISAIGDGFLVEFSCALDAARCAIEIQKTLYVRNASVPADRTIHLRIGMHVADVVHHDNDVFGDGVNIAARIEPLAGPGGICISRQMFELIRNKIADPLVSLGKGELKNIHLPVEIYRIIMPWETRRSGFSSRLAFRLRKRRTQAIAILVAALCFLLETAAWRYAREYTHSPAKTSIPSVSATWSATPQR